MFARKLLVILFSLAATTGWITLSATGALAACVRVVISTDGYSCHPNYCQPNWRIDIDPGEYGVLDDDDEAYWRLWDGRRAFWVARSAMSYDDSDCTDN